MEGLFTDVSALSKSEVLLRLLPDEVRGQIGNRNLTVRRSRRRTGFSAGSTHVEGGWKDEVISHTKPYDIYLGKRKAGEFDFHFEREEINSLEYKIEVDGKTYTS
jgi:hypothetical protein